MDISKSSRRLVSFFYTAFILILLSISVALTLATGALILCVLFVDFAFTFLAKYKILSA